MVWDNSDKIFDFDTFLLKESHDSTLPWEKQLSDYFDADINRMRSLDFSWDTVNRHVILKWLTRKEFDKVMRNNGCYLVDKETCSPIAFLDIEEYNWEILNESSSNETVLFELISEISHNWDNLSEETQQELLTEYEVDNQDNVSENDSALNLNEIYYIDESFVSTDYKKFNKVLSLKSNPNKKIELEVSINCFYDEVFSSFVYKIECKEVTTWNSFNIYDGKNISNLNKYNIFLKELQESTSYRLSYVIFNVLLDNSILDEKISILFDDKYYQF